MIAVHPFSVFILARKEQQRLLYKSRSRSDPAMCFSTWRLYSMWLGQGGIFYTGHFALVQGGGKLENFFFFFCFWGVDCSKIRFFFCFVITLPARCYISIEVHVVFETEMFGSQNKNAIYYQLSTVVAFYAEQEATGPASLKFQWICWMLKQKTGTACISIGGKIVWIWYIVCWFVHSSYYTYVESMWWSECSQQVKYGEVGEQRLMTPPPSSSKAKHLPLSSRRAIKKLDWNARDCFFLSHLFL